MANQIDADFKSIEGVHVLSDASYRKHVRTLPVLTCETCSKRHGESGGVNVNVKRCQGCWSVGFCSAECQKILWPNHKEHCKTLSSVLLLEELAKNFYSDPFLLHYLRIALIIKLNLLSPSPSSSSPSTLTFPSAPPPKSKFFPSVIVHFHMHPISKDHEMGLYTGEILASGKDKIPGYLTVGINDEPVSYIPISPGGGSKLQRQENQEYAMMLRSYKEARKQADENGREGNPIVMVDFGYNRELMNIGIEITADAFETARGNPPSDYAVLPTGIEPLATPVNVHSVLRIASKYIQLDEEDRLKLRKDLLQIDKVFLYHKAQYLVHGKGPSSFDGVY